MPNEMAIGALIAVNLFSFCLMGYDKRCAHRGKWRVSERRLFMAAVCFGALGGLLGMKVFRHKTRHWSFRIGFPLLMIIQCSIMAAIWLHGA